MTALTRPGWRWAQENPSADPQSCITKITLRSMCSASSQASRWLFCALASQVDDESVMGGLKGDLVLVVEHVGGHVGDDDALGGELVSVGVEVGVTEMVGDVLVPVV